MRKTLLLKRLSLKRLPLKTLPLNTLSRPTEIGLYEATALAGAATVIRHYSTSFGLAARMLTPRIREQVASIYALVRIADEIVDGAATGAGVGLAEQRVLLDELERETERAIRIGYSTNLVVHAFGTMARKSGIDERLTAPFFASMRRDLDPAPLDPAGVEEYIYGSAEVVGLMCLRAFLAEDARRPPAQRELENGARRLGAAFQKVNFLRDLASDRDALGRDYFPGIDAARLSEEDKNRLLDDIDADLAAANRVLPLLPAGSRLAVTAAHGLFSRLSAKLRATPAEQLLKARVRVPDAEKLVITMSSALSSTMSSALSSTLSSARSSARSGTWPRAFMPRARKR